MSRSYSPASLLRAVPVERWRELFQRFGHVFDSPDGDALERNLRLLDHGRRAEARRALQEIFTLGTTEGMFALWEMHRTYFADAPPSCLARMEEPRSTAMGVWLEAPELFAAALGHMKSAPRAWWSRRDDLPKKEARIDHDAMRAFADDISEILAPEGRGGRCTVEHHVDANGTQYYVCHPDDHPRSVTLHDRRGRLTTETLLPTFEIGFAYHPATGVLEAGVPNRSRIKRELQQAFAWTLLDHRLPAVAARPQYDLAVLKDTRFQLETDPADEIEAEVQAITIEIPDRDSTITLDSRERPGRDCVWRMMEECLNKRKLPFDALSLISAMFQVRFRGKDQRRNPRVSFAVEAPDRCTLRSACPDRVHKIHKHFQLWRICNAA